MILVAYMEPMSEKETRSDPKKIASFFIDPSKISAK